MYTETNYKSKKALIEDFKAGKTIRVFQPGPWGPNVSDGPGAIEGPHYPQPHKWYAEATIADGIITKVK